MHFVFENNTPHNQTNFVNCSDVNPSGIRRFTVSPVADIILSLSNNTSPLLSGLTNTYAATCSTIPPTDSAYIVASGVTHSPDDWAGGRGDGKESVFSFISPALMHDIRNKKAFLMLDQTHEGYQTDWLWSWFHENFYTYKIPPGQIIYITGNLLAESQYITWAQEHNIKEKMCVLAHPHFEAMIYETAANFNKDLVPSVSKGSRTPTFIDHVKYKENNLDVIKVYNALQKRPRAHRFWLFKHLVDAGLLNDGINTINSFTYSHVYMDNKHLEKIEFDKIAALTPIMPAETQNNIQEFVSECGGNYIATLNEHTMLNSYVSVISEASASDFDHTCFISEKTFKPIACYHPFIIWGNKGSLGFLKDLGYKTFSPYIDESYDNLSTWDRLNAIIKELKKIQSIPATDRINWYKQFENILHYNFEILKRNSKLKMFPVVEKLYDYVNNVQKTDKTN